MRPIDVNNYNIPLCLFLNKLGIKSAYIPYELTFFGTGVHNIVSGLPLGIHHISLRSGISIDGVKIK